MTSDPERDRRRVRPPPSAVLEALKHGTKPAPTPRLITSSDAVPNKPVDDERSTPIEIADPSLSSTIARIEYRQLTQDANQLEIARVLGDVRIEQAGMATALEGLLKLAEKDDLRKDKEEERRVARADKQDERSADLAKSRASGRQAIVLAIITAVVSIVGTLAIRSATSSPSSPAAVSR